MSNNTSVKISERSHRRQRSHRQDKSRKKPRVDKQPANTNNPHQLINDPPTASSSSRRKRSENASDGSKFWLTHEGSDIISHGFGPYLLYEDHLEAELVSKKHRTALQPLRPYRAPFFSRCLEPTTDYRKSGSSDWPEEFEKNCHTLLRGIEDLFVSVLENAHGHPDAQQIRGITFDVGVVDVQEVFHESLFEDRLGAEFFWEPNTSEFVWSSMTPYQGEIYQKWNAHTDVHKRYKTIVQYLFKNLTFANPNIAFRENVIPKNGVIQIVFDMGLKARVFGGVDSMTPLRFSIEENIKQNSLEGYNLDGRASTMRLTYRLSYRHQTAKNPFFVRMR